KDTMKLAKGTLSKHVRVSKVGSSTVLDVLTNSLQVRGDGGPDAITSSLPASPVFTTVAIVGGPGNDTLKSGRAADTRDRSDGNQGVRGGIGNDKLFGGIGNDTINSGTGNDFVDGGADADKITCGGPGDIITADGFDTFSADCF